MVPFPQIEFYNMSSTRRFYKWIVPILSFLLCQGYAYSQEQSGDGWQQLFNGVDLAGWITKIHHYDTGVNYGNTFRVRDSIIEVRYDEYEGDFQDRFGHLYYKEPFSYFQIALEYRFIGELHPGAPDYTLKNSGIMFHSQDPATMPKEQDWPISVEMQFLAGITPGAERPTGNMCSPGTDVEYEGAIYPGHCINSTSKTYFGDQWVRAEAIVLGDSLITHIINGDTVLKYSHPQIGGGVVNRFDPAIKKDGQPLTSGFIALQSEGQPVDFRNVRIRNLKGCMDPKAVNFKKYYVVSDPGSCSYN